MVLILVDAYIVLIFFKTVCLVISFSMIHGLLFLPIALMTIIPKTRAKQNAPPLKVSFTCSSQLNRIVETKKVEPVKMEHIEESEGREQEHIPASKSIVNKVIPPE